MTKDAQFNKLIWMNEENREEAIRLVKDMGKASLELEKAKAAFSKFIEPAITQFIEKGVDVSKIPHTVD